MSKLTFWTQMWKLTGITAFLMVLGVVIQILSPNVDPAVVDLIVFFTIVGFTTVLFDGFGFWLGFASFLLAKVLATVGIIMVSILFLQATNPTPLY